jgi:F0F1-type ATP synthase membrane subunit b/b'
MSFWTEVEAFFKSAFEKIKPFFDPLLKQFETSIGPSIIAAAEKEAANLGELGLEAITSQQFKDATDKILSDLKSQGITAAVSIIEAALSGALHNAAAAPIVDNTKPV